MKLGKILIGTAVLSMLIVSTGCNKDKKKSSSGDANDALIKQVSVELGDYYGLEIEMDKVDVTEDEIKQEIDGYLSSYEVKDEENKEVDDKEKVNINYKGTMDGKEFEGGSAEDTPLEIGSNSFIDGFEKGLIGKKVGETVTLNLKFPENYGEEMIKSYEATGAKEQLEEYKEKMNKLRGKDVKFEVKINYIYAKTPTELTDEVLKKDDKAEFKTVDEYKADIKKNLMNKKEEESKTDLLQKVLEKIVENAKYSKLTDKAVDAYFNKQLSKLEEGAKQQGATLEQLAPMYGCKDVNDLKKQLKELSKDALKQEVALDAIAKKEKMETTDKEFDEYIKSMKTQMAAQKKDVKKEDVLKQLGASEEEVKLTLSRQKVMKQLQEKTKVVYKEKKAEDRKDDKSDENKKDEKSDEKKD